MRDYAQTASLLLGYQVAGVIMRRSGGVYFRVVCVISPPRRTLLL